MKVLQGKLELLSHRWEKVQSHRKYNFVGSTVLLEQHICPAQPLRVVFMTFEYIKLPGKAMIWLNTGSQVTSVSSIKLSEKRWQHTEKALPGAIQLVLTA